MITIQTRATVDEQGMMTLRLPAHVAPGEHELVVVIEEPAKTRAPLSFSSHDVGPWPFSPGETFRREDLYGDDGH
jgi:hypothetical protein